MTICVLVCDAASRAQDSGMNYPIILRLLSVIVLVSVVALVIGRVNLAQTKPAPRRCEISFPLPNPSDIGTAKFEKLLYEFLEKDCYQSWISDNQIRNTGPFIDGVSYGTHNAVKIYYSPEVWTWLKVKHREGEIPDGAMIVKEMFPAPAKQDAKLAAWTVMVKDKKGAYDGWYWSYHAPNFKPDDPTIDYPDSGFGLYCLRCHASAEKESTFIALKNVEGDPISFTIRAPTMQPLPPPNRDEHEKVAETKEIKGGPFGTALKFPNPKFLNFFAGLPLVPESAVKRFPGESFDHVVPAAGGPQGFLTSSQCLGCHSASKENMAFLFEEKLQPPINLSPYTEWRASMMGLAGRDPIFHAQLESEKTMRPSQTAFFDNTCYRCHGVMGQRQLESDKDQPFRHEMVYALPNEADGEYGHAADEKRDGHHSALRRSHQDLGAVRQLPHGDPPRL